MKRILSKLNTKSPEFQKNKIAMEAQLHTLTTRLRASQTRPSPSKKWSVTTRIETLLDPGSPFLALSPLAGYELYADPLPAGGIITGIGLVADTECIIIANDPTVKAGTYYPITVKKHLRAQQIALDNHLPCIYLVDSGGAYLPMQAEVFPDEQHFGAIFYNQTQLSIKNIPQIAIVMGSCTAGGAYVPAMSDEVIMVKDQGTIFLGGPPLVKAAIGEIIDAETLGGADTHCRLSGVSDYYAETEAQALEMARQIISRSPPKSRAFLKQQPYHEPAYEPQEILGIIPTDPKKPYPTYEIIARLVDDSRFDAFKANYAQTLICGFAYIHGYLVGILANDGILFSESALKATHFIELCAKRKIPLVFLQNITGFMVGRQAEQHGIAKHGAKMVHAVAAAQVPKFSIIMGNSYGAGNYAMCGRAYRPRFLFMWPNARIGIMGGDQAARVLSDIKRKQHHKNQQDWSEQDANLFQEKVRSSYHAQASPYYATARLWDDGIISPIDSARILGLCLAAASKAPISETQFGIMRM